MPLQTWAPRSCRWKAQVEKLEGELDQYFGEWFTDTMFFGEEDPSPYLVHYMISPRDFFVVRVMAVAGMAAAALGTSAAGALLPPAPPGASAGGDPGRLAHRHFLLPGRLSPMIWATPLSAPIRPTETISIDVQAQGLPLGLFFPFFTGRRCILCQSMVYWYQPQPPGRACAAGIKKGGYH